MGGPTDTAVTVKFLINYFIFEESNYGVDGGKLKMNVHKKEVYLFEEIFALKDFSMEETASYQTENSILMDGDTLTLLTGNESQYPVIPIISRSYFTDADLHCSLRGCFSQKLKL